MLADLQRQLGIDSTFFHQLVIFLLAYLLMRFFYFGPYLKLIQKRENQSDGLSDEAKKLEEEAASMEGQYQASLSAARKKAQAEREAMLAAVRKLNADEVAEARNQGKSKLEQGREAATRSSASELANLKAQAGPISATLVEKLMNNKVGL